MRTELIFREKIENSSSGALVIHMTSNLIISRRYQDENGKEMDQNVKHTCRTRGGMNSIPDVFSASRPSGNSKMACSVDEIHDLLRDYFVGFVDYNGE